MRERPERDERQQISEQNVLQDENADVHLPHKNGGATLDDLREAANILEETTQNVRRVLGSAHPVTKGMEDELQLARAALSARESS